MSQTTLSHSMPPKTSTLMLSDRLLTLAQEADRAGCVNVADRLVVLAHAVLDRPMLDRSALSH